MRRSASLRRRRTGWSRSWSFDEGGEFLLVGFPSHVVRVVMAGALDQDELHRASGGGGYLVTHLDGHQHVGRPVEDERGAVNAAHSAHVVEPKPHQKPGEDSVVSGRHSAGAREG